MTFAKQEFDFPYWHRQTEPLFADLAWNIPEQRTGTVGVIGGSSQGFRGVVKFAEGVEREFPIQAAKILLPDVLAGKMPVTTNLDFAPSTVGGTFAKSNEIGQFCQSCDLVALVGDLSKNSETTIALTAAIQALQSDAPSRPLLITRDAVDTLAPESATILGYPNLILVATMAQLQKVFRALYYPRMLMLSQSLIATIETLHKFTLSYPATILTLHEGQVIVAENGEISTTPLDRTDYSVLTLWAGDLAAKVAGYNLYNPQKGFMATTAAVLA